MSAFTEFIDLASGRLGGKVLAANDDFFASKENLLRPEPPVFIPEKYTSRGKWMDGWETRRRRTPGHDWCVIRLAFPGIIRGVDVETTHFTGNHPEHCLIEAADIAGKITQEQIENEKFWTPVLRKSKLKGNARNLFSIANKNRWTHVKLHIYPDGGVARLRVYGEVAPEWSAVKSGERLDLAGAHNGGRVIACSDMTFSSGNNLILPDRGKNMGDGWETKRRRGPGHDWAVIKLGAPGTVEEVEVDTTHFKGNAPGECSIEGFPADSEMDETLFASLKTAARFKPALILPKIPLKPDSRHHFTTEILKGPVCRYIRFNIFPDGGVSRLRIYGNPNPVS